MQSYTETCSGHGTASGSSCPSCTGHYTGDKCQFPNDCTTNSDCNGGTCVTIEGNSYPKKQCFCPKGKFGFNCESKSEITQVLH